MARPVWHSKSAGMLMCLWSEPPFAGRCRQRGFLSNERTSYCYCVSLTRQSIGVCPVEMRNSFALEKGRLPKKPLEAERGDG